MSQQQEIRKKTIRVAKKILGIPQNQCLTPRVFQKYFRLRYGPWIYKKKIRTEEIIEEMKKMGMKRGSNIFIHSSWDEMYNYNGSEENLIDAILEIIGPQGTLIMPAFPLLRKGKIFNVKKSVTGAGTLAETFRRYPGVKRSINVQHSVCALGPQSDFLLAEHHLGESCWDEKSPYFRLSQIDALVFTLGLRKYYIGTMLHCVESVLRKDYPYYSSFYTPVLVKHEYIDLDGKQKCYYCYDKKIRIRDKLFGTTTMVKKHFAKEWYACSQISNLIIGVYHAKEIIPHLINLGKKGIDVYQNSGKKGYKFDK
ncbi:AAC(3) family N-acetyltransferase [Gabonibacter chumensis]|uniref:AAC(3) family N-acetyltransferase n=1 Tax=Gabonibacter chumensis TaxID=2972474 RepID=UPI002573EF87|nr:AAC(3) family N-acetyltransferase [Gabonibacter chumensis]MCR9012810.1 AAC(3) family N-acetyltransferase [Gabonibacter chumensis]